MSKVLDMLRRGKSRTGTLVAVVAAAIIVPATLYAWGPTDRPTYTAANPADHVTFNSITDNSDYGDERNFVRIKDAANTNAGGWSDTIKAEPGKEYLVQMYVHNNAASSLNLTATNTRVMANVPTTTGKQVQIDGFISADNATPNEVWDQAIFTGDTDFNLAYVEGSATMYNNVFPTGTPVNDSIVTSAGAPVGYDKMDGNLPGCFKYSGYVSFKVKPQFAETTNFTVKKEVSKHGANNWVENYQAQPGETVDYLIEYRNTGSTQQDNVVIKDTLPANMQYVAGSTKYGTAANPGGQQASDNITTTGINIGSYAAGSGTWAMFSAKVPGEDKLECGNNTLKNVARVETDAGYKEDDANVTVPKECQPNKIKVCDLTTKQIITINEDDFDASKHSKNLEDCKEKTIIVCELATNKIVTIKESEFDASKYSKNLDDCKEKPSQIIVCDLTTKQIITINEDDFDASKHSKNLEDCKTPEDKCPIPGKEHLPAYSAECETPVTPTPPTTPTELPQTGSTDGVLTIAGLATLALALGYAVTARRTLG